MYLGIWAVSVDLLGLHAGISGGRECWINGKSNVKLNVCFHFENKGKIKTTV